MMKAAAAAAAARERLSVRLAASLRCALHQSTASDKFALHPSTASQLQYKYRTSPDYT